MSAAREYIAAHGVQEALATAVCEVLRTRPADPILGIRDILLAMEASKSSAKMAVPPSKEPMKLPPVSTIAPVIDVSSWLNDPSSVEAQMACKALAESLKATGIALLRDSRVSEADEVAFLDLMEDYFAQPDELKMADVRKEFHYQVGATPSMVEIPICKTDAECIERIEGMPSEHKPLPISGPDPKWRFFWRIGERPKEVSGYEDLNAAPVHPAAFPRWGETMDRWGHLMLASVSTCAEMAAVGFGLPSNAITSLMEHGPHLLAPTGSDLGKHHEVNTILAGFHNDLNLLTIHGKSRYPGLHVWLRDGTKRRVAIPNGCLLVQAGMQMERLTGGQVIAGMHEVVVLPETVEVAERRAAAGRPPWRISSTLFAHVASTKELRPLGDFATEEALRLYPPTTAGEQVLSVLRKINLADPSKAPRSY